MNSRMKRCVWTALVALALVGAGRAGVAAQGIPAAVTPDPAGCQVEGRSFDEIVALFAGVATPEAERPAEVTIPVGSAADAATVDGVTATVHELVACFNAGDFGRALALFTPAAIPVTFPWLGPELTDSEELRGSFEAPQPLDQEEWQTILVVSAVSRLPDGRVGALIVIVDPISERDAPDAIYLIFARPEDRWQVDEARFLGED